MGCIIGSCGPSRICQMSFLVGSGVNLNGPKLSGIKTPSGVHRGYRTV